MLYEKLSPEITERILADRARGTSPRRGAGEEMALRRNPARDRASLWRPAYARDVDKILHSAYYSRYQDKTQVFSFTHNDDVTRRALHVQLVSRIARGMGAILGLDLDLIEAIALGHDIGHTPFGHAGEKYLSALYRGRTGRYFNHNVHSVRVLDTVFPYNLSLPTLDGILSHNGEIELAEYRPRPLSGFAEFDRRLEDCYREQDGSASLVPSTLEGCLVRISDIIAYLGKDRQDATRAGLIPDETVFREGAIGRGNSELINNLTVNVIEHSYGKDAICMDGEHFRALTEAKRENYGKIYLSGEVSGKMEDTVRPMMEEMYDTLRRHFTQGITSSPLFRHHVALVDRHRGYYGAPSYLEAVTADDAVTDYLASMTDDYFVELYRHLFPKSPREIKYEGYAF